MKRRLSLLLGLAAIAGEVASHETRPAYLEIEQLQGHQYQLAFRQPQISGRFLGLEVTSDCILVGEQQQTVGGSALESRWVEDCGEVPITQAGLRVQGLERTLVDTLVLVRTADGQEATYVLTPKAPTMAAAAKGLSFLPAYFTLGVEHLVFGIDHVAFLLALMYLLRGFRKLVIAITSFTLAHSLTLALAALELVRVPQQPVEAIIALSILVVGYEVVAGKQRSLLNEKPWTLTFAFGLLHGLGFAGAMAEIGLPDKSALTALLLFNLGIEAGQLLIVALVAIGLGLIRAARLAPPAWVHLAPIYVICSLASYWFIDRSVGILLGS